MKLVCQALSAKLHDLAVAPLRLDERPQRRNGSSIRMYRQPSSGGAVTCHFVAADRHDERVGDAP